MTRLVSKLVGHNWIFKNNQLKTYPISNGKPPQLGSTVVISLYNMEIDTSYKKRVSKSQETISKAQEVISKVLKLL
jgi:hypothetical protein